MYLRLSRTPKSGTIYTNIVAIVIMIGIVTILTLGCVSQKNDRDDQVDRGNVSEAISNNEESIIDGEEVINKAEKYIQEHMPNLNEIDYQNNTIVTIESIKESDEGMVEQFVLFDGYSTINNKDLYVQVGESTEFDYRILLMDSETLEVKGCIPIY